MNKKTFVVAFITIIAWSSGFAGIRASLLGGFEPFNLVLYRFLIASFVFIVYAFFMRSHFTLPKKEDLIQIFALGFIGITLYHVGSTFGQQTVEAGTASMIVGSAPIFTSIIAVIFLREKMEWYAWVGLFIGFIGITLITVGSSGAFTISPGIIYVILATIATSIFFVFQKPLFQKYNPIELTAYFTWTGTIPLLIFFPSLLNNFATVTVEANWAAIYVGIVPAAICYATWAIALSMGDVSKVTGMMYLEPAFAILIAWIWLKEFPTVLSIIGGIIAISSVAIVNLVRSRKSRKNNVTI